MKKLGSVMVTATGIFSEWFVAVCSVMSDIVVFLKFDP